MPIYDWECKKCKKSVDVVRPFSESDLPPDKGVMDERDGCEHEWTKVIGGKQIVMKSSSWGRGKGFW